MPPQSPVADSLPQEPGYPVAMETDEPPSSADNSAQSDVPGPKEDQLKDDGRSSPSLPRRGLLPPPGTEAPLRAKKPQEVIEEPGQMKRWIMKPGEVKLPYDQDDYYVPLHDPRWFCYVKSGPEVQHELIIDKRGFELPLGGLPRKFNLDGKQVKMQAVADTRQILINDKPLYKIGGPVIEMNVTGTPHMVYYHGPLKKMWIDGFLFEVQADAPPLRVIIANEECWLRLDDSSGDVIIGEVSVCKYGCPARKIKIKDKEHDIQFIPPPRQILIDNKLCGLDFRGQYPFIVISNKAHGIRFDGPPREILIDGQSLVVPMHCSRKASFGNKRPHILSFGGPGHEIIIDGKWYEVKFGGPPKDVQVGLHMISIHLVGPPPEVKILGEMVNNPDKVKELSEGMEINPMYAVLPNIKGLYEDKVVRFQPLEEKPAEPPKEGDEKEAKQSPPAKDSEPDKKPAEKPGTPTSTPVAPGKKEPASKGGVKPAANKPLKPSKPELEKAPSHPEPQELPPPQKPPALRGPPGKQGPPGQHGPAGPRGPSDPRGPPGRPADARGPPGPRGPSDSRGPPGPRGPLEPRGPPGLRGTPEQRGPPDLRGLPDVRPTVPVEPNRGPPDRGPPGMRHMRTPRPEGSDIPYMGNQPRPPRPHGRSRGPYDRQPGPYDRQPGSDRPFDRHRNDGPRGPYPRQRGPYDRQPNMRGGPGQAIRGQVPPADMRVPPDMYPAPHRGGPAGRMIRHPGPDHGPSGPNMEPHKGPDGGPNIMNMLGNMPSEMLQNLTAIARGLPPGLSGLLPGSQPGPKPALLPMPGTQTNPQNNPGLLPQTMHGAGRHRQ